MPKRYRWIETSGGPHLLLPEELLGFWRGIEDWHDHADPSDKSDYARARRIRSWIGVIPCHTGNGLVLSGDAGPVAWIAGANQDGGVLVQWLGADDEARIGDALRSRELANALEGPDAEEVEFPTGASIATLRFCRIRR